MKIKNISWTLNGLITPILVALVSFPIIIDNVGMERFGILSLAWGLIGYAGVFDLGIGRATTQLTSKYVGLGETRNARATLKVAEKLSFIVGSMGGGVLITIIILGGWRIINVSPEVEHEIFYSSFIVAVTIPFQCMSTMYRGYCEAFEKFKEVSIARVFLGVMNFAGPCVISYYSTNVALMISTILTSRIVAVVIYWMLSNKLGVDISVENSPLKLSERAIQKNMLKFGGWYTVSSIISPFLVQIDKIFIGVMVSATAIGVYTVPYEVVTKTIIFASALSTVAFPRYSSLWVNNRQDAFKEFNKWLVILIVGMLIGCSMLAFILPELLLLWIGNTISESSILIGRVLCVGIFFNSIGVMYYTLIHASGDSKSTAFIHLFELPLYLGCLFILVKYYGTTGAAIAWTSRMIIDSFLMAIVANKKNHE